MFLLCMFNIIFSDPLNYYTFLQNEGFGVESDRRRVTRECCKAGEFPGEKSGDSNVYMTFKY